MGFLAERRAKKFLQSKGMKLVDKNFSTQVGEIDLIMLDEDTLVFVEVRYRSGKMIAQGYETVDWHKQKKIIKTSELFLQSHPRYCHYFSRFDVVSFSTDLSTPIWFKSAFDCH